MPKNSAGITTIIFDLGEVYLRGFRKVESLLIPILKLDEKTIHDQIYTEDSSLHELFTGDITEDEYWASLISRTGWDIDIDTLKAAVRKNFVEIEGTRALIEELKEKGFKLGLLSDHTREWIEYCDGKFDYHKLFNSVLYSYEAKAMKPEKKVYEMILKNLDSRPEENIFIDDKPKNLVPAKEMGIHTILFKDSKQLREELKALGIIL